MIRVFLAFVFSAISVISFAETPSGSNQGKIFMYWGWNRSSYTDSDISFKGNDYAFKLKGVVAHDRQTPFSAGYFNPKKITIPQYNFRVGYYFNPKYSISFGFDHMKYVMDQNQRVKIKGNILNSQTEYDGVYDNETIALTDNFLQFEHTDGLNYLNLELRKMDNLFGQKNIAWKNLEVNLIEGVGAGFMFPKSNVVLLNNERNDQWHVAGYGVNAVVGLNVTFFKHFFIQGEVKGGFINMPDILTTQSQADRAKQNFFFLQGNTNFGVLFKL